MRATLENLIADLRAEAPMIPYQLHEGIRDLTRGFGGEFDFVGGSVRCADFLEQYSNERKPEGAADLLWLYHNDMRFHAFVERMCEESIEAYKEHHEAWRTTKRGKPEEEKHG